MKPIVIKISGHHLDDPAYLTAFAQAIQHLRQPAIIINGGGKEITYYQQKLGIAPVYVDGLRVTDRESLAIVVMVMAGLVNKRLVHHLTTAGIDAIGISGVDRGIIEAQQQAHPTVDMQYTGDVVRVRGDILREMLAAGLTPVLSPVSADHERMYNLNADPVTGAVASAIEAEQVIFVSNVAGVLVDGAHQPTLTPARVQTLIADGTIYGGMIPKVNTALQILDAGIPSVTITDLDGLKRGGGTRFVP